MHVAAQSIGCPSFCEQCDLAVSLLILVYTSQQFEHAKLVSLPISMHRIIKNSVLKQGA